jgi:hypothetical protein
MMTGGEERWGGETVAGGYRSWVKNIKNEIEVEAHTGGGVLVQERGGEACTGGGEA